MTLPKYRPPTHPGEILLEEFLKPRHLTQQQAAHKMGISLNRLNEIVRGKRGVTADTALRLANLCQTTPQFWLNLLIESRGAARRSVDRIRTGLAVGKT